MAAEDAARTAAGAAVSGAAAAAGGPIDWSAADFEAAAMAAHAELLGVSVRVLDGLERALRRECIGEGVAGEDAGMLSRLLRYERGEGDAAAPEPAGREPEGANVTLSMIRYVRKGAAVATSAADSGEVNAAIQPQGTGIPCAAHTDASMLTLIVAPSQPGLELFATTHPTTAAAAAAAAAAYLKGRSVQGATAAGADSVGEWVSGFSETELTRVEDGDGNGDGDSGATATAAAATLTATGEEEEDFVTLVAMGGDMLVHASGGVLPATRHRVVCWPAEVQRLSLIMGCYGADDKTLEPSRFRVRVAGLPPSEDLGLASMGCRSSRQQKLYLDPEVRNAAPQEAGQASEHK